MVEQDPAAVFSLGEELVEIVNRHHVFYWECFTEGLLGWAFARTGDLDKSLTRPQRSWEIRARMQTRIWGSYFRISEADILVQNQRNDKAIALLDRVAADANGPRFDDAEGLRVPTVTSLGGGLAGCRTS
jgi:hypothetical protein